VGQHKVVVGLEQDQLIQQACFALAERVHPASNRRYALADMKVKSVTVGRRITTPTADPDRSVP
jgi:hypothetical protein